MMQSVVILKQIKTFNSLSLGRATTKKRGQLIVTLIRPLSILLSGYTRYFGSWLLSFTRTFAPKHISFNETIFPNKILH